MNVIGAVIVAIWLGIIAWELQQIRKVLERTVKTLERKPRA